jgi:hypothetical protein
MQDIERILGEAGLEYEVLHVGPAALCTGCLTDADLPIAA